MNMVIPNEGKAAWLDDLFGGVAPEDFLVDLFQSNTTVVNASTAADFTIATFTGYNQVALARAGFSAAAIVANVAVTTSAVAPTFLCTGGAAQTVYGWILRGDTTGLVYAGQNFDVPRVMSNGISQALDPFAIRLKTFT